MVEATKHAAKRTKERVGLRKTVADKNAERAFLNGLTQNEARGEVKKYMEHVAFQSKGEVTAVRVYGECVYIFGDYKGHPSLITVLLIPQGIRAKAAQQLKNKRQKSAKESST